MTQEATTRNLGSAASKAYAEWPQAYMTNAAALGASWCDFVGQRFQAYAHVIDDVSHCHDLNDAWKVQATFGQQTFKAYSDQAARVSGLVMQVAKGNGGDAKH